MSRYVTAGASNRGGSVKTTLLRCPRRFALERLLHVDHEVSEPLARGILVHAAVAQHNARVMSRQNGWDSDWATPTEAIDHEVATSLQPVFAKVRDEALDLWHLYEASPMATPTWDVLAVEHPVELWLDGDGKLLENEPNDAQARRMRAALRPLAPFPDAPYLHTGRLDSLIRYRGRIRIHDVKTAARVGKKKIEAYQLTLSFAGYDAWGRLHYPNYDGVHAIFVDRGRRKVEARELHVTAETRRLFGLACVEFEERFERLARRQPLDWPAVLSEQGPCFDRYGQCPYVRACAYGVGGAVDLDLPQAG